MMELTRSGRTEEQVAKGFRTEEILEAAGVIAADEIVVLLLHGIGAGERR